MCEFSCLIARLALCFGVPPSLLLCPSPIRHRHAVGIFKSCCHVAATAATAVAEAAEVAMVISTSELVVVVAVAAVAMLVLVLLEVLVGRNK